MPISVAVAKEKLNNIPKLENVEVEADDLKPKHSHRIAIMDHGGLYGKTTSNINIKYQ